MGNCGAVLSPLDLISPKSTLSGKVRTKTTHWYLPLDQHEKWLKDWVKDGILDKHQLTRMEKRCGPVPLMD